ncbi:alpha/beta fold hydrolase [Methylorubrum extorquens]|uniref:alpha/beta fold hydrolase n=1 Tax=Methylorubrum extorquens TaxID=408 RepID=UPI000162957C|nr:alpha/beta hydrolase [Methylorubrum extorquens]ABY28598.1 hypothetical protein Mext_0172 [Methylorubrum extorquens PA1]
MSEKPPQALTVRELADALAAWMHEVGLKRAAFVGNSLSCEVTVELALHHPELVSRLVLQLAWDRRDSCGPAQQLAP